MSAVCVGLATTVFESFLSYRFFRKQLDTEVLDTLMPEIRFEPRAALDGGPGGMRYIERIIPDAADFIRPGGWLLVEMDPSQIPTALELIERTGRYRQAKAVKDYSRRLRIVAAQLA